MHTVQNGSMRVFRLLLDHGVDLDIESEVRVACLAASKGQEVVMASLFESVMGASETPHCNP